MANEMSYHGPSHPWNQQSAHTLRQYRYGVIKKWCATFDSAEIGAAFCVALNEMWPHTVKRTIAEIEEQTGKQFIYTTGAAHKFIRVL